MLKKYKWTLLVTSLVILLPTVAGLLLWNRLPQEVAIHWGVSGEPDGWANKAVAVFALPAFLLAIQWLCLFVTHNDKRNKEQSPKLMALVLWLCPVLSLLLGGATYTVALGGSVRMEMVAPVAMGVLFLIVGNYMPKATRNYTVGIKLPWTLDSDENWNATHRLAGKVWVVGGLALIACAFIPSQAVTWVSLGAVFVLAAIPTVYSYWYYKKHK